jgi:ankyrin repeat protein
MVAQEGYVKLACVLFEHGAYVTGQANDGQTPLHMALKEGHVEVVCILIKHGAEGIAETNNGWTPLLKRANKLTQQVCTWSIELLDIFLFFLFFSLYPQM